jgi:hypothetical protein
MKNLLLFIACCISSLVAAQGRHGVRDNARLIIRDMNRTIHQNAFRQINRQTNRNITRAYRRDLSREFHGNGRSWREEKTHGLTRVFEGSMNQQMRHVVRSGIRENIHLMRNMIRHSVRGYRLGRQE